MPALSKLLVACVVAFAAASEHKQHHGNAMTLSHHQVTEQALTHEQALGNFDQHEHTKSFDILKSLMTGNTHGAIASLKDLMLYKQSVLGKTICNSKVHKMFSTSCNDADETSPPWFLQFCQEMKAWRAAHPDDPCLPCEPGSKAGAGVHLPGHANCAHGAPPPSPPLPPHPPEHCWRGDFKNVVGWESCTGACLYPPDSAYRRCAFSSEAGGPATEDECLMLAASVTGVMAVEMERVNTSHICHVFLPWDTLCYEVGLGRKTVGYHSSGCKNCLEYRYSPPGFLGKHCKSVTMPPSPPPAPLNPDRPTWETSGTDWVCSWPCESFHEN